MMKKHGKKIVGILLVLIMVMPMIAGYKAETIADYRKQLAKLEAQLAANKSSKVKTESEIKQARVDIANAKDDIEKGREQIEEANEEIERLNKEIKEKEEQTKELVRFLQIANGENSYLEYVFGATSMTDLINRLAIVEQLSKYNEELIQEMNDLIAKNEKLKVDLANKEKALEKKITDLEKKTLTLNDDLVKLGQAGPKLEDDIKIIKDQIKTFVDMGCKEDQDIRTCGGMPTDTGFIRPLTKGIVSSNYGPRDLMGRTYHYGTDIATGSEGKNVYPVANGQVAGIIRKAYCGGNMLFINHLVNGKKYTSGYLHLQSIKVKVGDKVYRDTVIAKSGGGTSTFAWEHCSTGPHLHLELANGWYSNYSKHVANSFNSRKKIYFPSGWFTTRS